MDKTQIYAQYFSLPQARKISYDHPENGNYQAFSDFILKQFIQKRIVWQLKKTIF